MTESNVFAFTLKEMPDEQTRQRIEKDIENFNKQYCEIYIKKLDKVPLQIKQKFGHLFMPFAEGNLIEKIEYGDKKIVITLRKDFIEFYDAYSFGLGKILNPFKKNKENSIVLRRILRKAINDYVEVID